MIDIEKLTALAIAYDAGDAKQIQHFIKVYAYSRLLGRREGLDEQKQNVLEAAAVLHDIGIHEAERKHGSNGLILFLRCPRAKNIAFTLTETLENLYQMLRRLSRTINDLTKTGTQRPMMIQLGKAQIFIR